MSKKHFEAVAAAIKDVYTATDTRSLSHMTERDVERINEILFGIRETAEALANVFADANPRFDRARFLAACGIN